MMWVFGLVEWSGELQYSIYLREANRVHVKDGRVTNELQGNEEQARIS